MSTESVLREVAEERSHQETKWGQQNHPWLFGKDDVERRESRNEWAETVEPDDAKMWVDTFARYGWMDYAGILTEEYYEALFAAGIDDVRAELVQVAAVAVAAIESIDRNGH